MTTDLQGQPLAGGTLHRHADVAPAALLARHVDVWCPPGYAAQPERRYPVIYMHDGQNVFDPALSFTGVDWGVAPAVRNLMAAEGLPGAIIVGVWNTPRRVIEYMPAAPLHDPAAAPLLAEFIEKLGGPPESDAYLSFLATELKPLIDATYRTLPDRANTAIMGSSMGGLISLYAVERHPAVFGAAACLSTHWPIGGDLLVDALAAALPPAGQHRLYFDFGTAGLDAAYEPLQRRMDEHLRAAGYRAGHDTLTVKADGAEHNEAAWRARITVPVAFLLRGQS